MKSNKIVGLLGVLLTTTTHAYLGGNTVPSCEGLEQSVCHQSFYLNQEKDAECIGRCVWVGSSKTCINPVFSCKNCKDLCRGIAF